MRYRTFKTLRILLLFLIVAATVKVCSMLVPSRNDSTSAHNYENTVSGSISDKKQNNDMSNDGTPKLGDQFLQLSDIDNRVLEMQLSDITDVKDKSGKNYKKFKKFPTFIIDMRCDFTKGFTTWNRIKVDLDKDKKYDEKWTFRNNGEVIKEISSSDDENYDYEYKMKDKKWELR